MPDNNSQLEKQKKYMIVNIVVISIMMSSTILVGIGLFDRSNTLGVQLYTIGFIPLAALSLFLLLRIKTKNKEYIYKMPTCWNGILLFIAGTMLVGIGLFNTENKLDNFTTGSVGFALIAFYILLCILNMVNWAMHYAQEIKQCIRIKQRELLTSIRCDIIRYKECNKSIDTVLAEHRRCHEEYSRSWHSVYSKLQQCPKLDEQYNLMLYVGKEVERYLVSDQSTNSSLDECIQRCEKYLVSLYDAYSKVQKHPELQEQVDNLFSQYGLQKSDLGIFESNNISFNLQDISNSSGVETQKA